VNDQTFDVIAGQILRLVARFEITGGVKPVPPVPPGPDPPNPQEVPFPAPGLAVLIIGELQETGPWSEAQKAILTNYEIRGYLWDHCVKIDGQPAFRYWDDDMMAEHMSNVSPVLRTAYTEVLKQANGRVPWIGISTGKSGASQPLPATVEDTLNLLKKYGG
jgi:hypothetical protein